MITIGAILILAVIAIVQTLRIGVLQEHISMQDTVIETLIKERKTIDTADLIEEADENEMY